MHMYNVVPSVQQLTALNNPLSTKSCNNALASVQVTGMADNEV